MHNIYYRMYSLVNILYMARRVLKSLFGTSWITKNIMDSLHTHLKATRSCLFMTTVFSSRRSLSSTSRISHHILDLREALCGLFGSTHGKELYQSRASLNQQSWIKHPCKLASMSSERTSASGRSAR